MHYIGIDVSKKKLDICMIVDTEIDKKKSKVIANDASAINQFLAWLDKQGRAPEEVKVVIEPTGVYHERFCYQLYEAGIRVSVVNAYRVREFARGLGILTKNDTVDAYVLARFGHLGDPACWQPPAEEVRILNALLQRRDALAQDVLKERNRLEAQQTSLEVKEVLSSINVILQSLEQELAVIEELISEHIDRHPGLKEDMSLLSSIKCVGPQVGGHMLTILRTHNFANAEQVAAYLGVVPIERRSGTSVRGAARLSKAGPPEIRAKLYMAALTAIRFNPHVKALYERLLNKGKPKKLALGAAMRKLVHLCYGVLHTRQRYDENYASCG